MRYENLEEGLEKIRQHVGLPKPIELPRLRSGFRDDNRDYRKHYSDETRGNWWRAGTPGKSKRWVMNFRLTVSVLFQNYAVNRAGSIRAVALAPAVTAAASPVASVR